MEGTWAEMSLLASMAAEMKSVGAALAAVPAGLSAPGGGAQVSCCAEGHQVKIQPLHV